MSGFSLRGILVILLAMFCGVTASAGLILLNKRVQTSANTEPEATVPVVVARAELRRGQLLTADQLEVKQWPKSIVPPQAVGAIDDAIDRAALQTMMVGEPLLDTKLAARGAVGGMAGLIPRGMRAYTVQTQRVATNVAGFILPGNLVDVLLTFRGTSNDETGGGSTTTLLQAVEVLAVGKQIGGGLDAQDTVAHEVESVTLLVNPEQATRLDLGQSLGMLSLALRNPTDRDESETSPATIANIRFSQLSPNDRPGLTDHLQTLADALGSFRRQLFASATASATEEVRAASSSESSRKPTSATILTLRALRWDAVSVNSQNQK